MPRIAATQPSAGQPAFEATNPDDLHMELAEKFQCKLPRREYQSKRVTITTRQARFIHGAGLSWAEVTQWTGEHRGDYFLLNADADLRTWAGELLERLWLAGWDRGRKWAA